MLGFERSQLLRVAAYVTPPSATINSPASTVLGPSAAAARRHTQGKRVSATLATPPATPAPPAATTTPAAPSALIMPIVKNGISWPPFEPRQTRTSSDWRPREADRQVAFVPAQAVAQHHRTTTSTLADALLLGVARETYDAPSIDAIARCALAEALADHSVRGGNVHGRSSSRAVRRVENRDVAAASSPRL